MTLKKRYVAPLAVIGSVALYAAAGFWALPGIATSKLPTLVKESVGLQPKLQAIRFNPFTFQLEADGFELPAADGKSFFSVATFAVDLDVWQSLRKGGVVLNSLSLIAPNVNIERHADGKFNFSDLLPKQSVDKKPENGQDSATLPVLIHQLAVENGQAVWLDGLVGQDAQETVMPINLAVSELSTDADGAAKFELTLDLTSGGKLNWQGDLQPLALASNGKIKLDNLNLSKVGQLFLQAVLPLTIMDGNVSLQADYQLKNSDAGLQLLFSNAGLDVKKLDLTDKSQSDSLLKIPSFTVQGVDVDVSKQLVNIKSVSSSDASILAWLQSDGQLNYQTLFAAKPTANPTVTPSSSHGPAGKPWLITLNDLSLTNYQLRFTDHSQPKPEVMVLSELNCKLQNFSTAAGGKFPLQVSTRFNKSGALTLSGDVSPEPFNANWSIELRDISLKTFQSYIDPFVALELVDGDFNTRGKLTLKTADELQVGFQGDASIDNLITRDKVKNKDFVKWANLDVRQIAIDVPKQDFKFGKVLFDQPYFRFSIKKDRTNNIDDLLVNRVDAKSVKPSATAGKPGPEPVISIGKVEIKGGKSDFSDYSLILPFIAQMNSLNGEVDGFTSNTDVAAKLKLNGKVYDLATVAIKGSYQFKSNDSDIALNFSHMPLPLITPYMAEFAGYKIEKGQMALDLKYAIKHGQLAAQNKILIDQLVLGEKVENPKAVSLPLELAIALLKDGDGKINLDFPISGSLEDPQFSVGSLVADVLVNLVTKVAAAPFKAIASLFDGDDDPGTVRFAAGTSELAPEVATRLSQIGQALKDKPELVLEIKGVAYQVQDWPAMRSDVLLEILKKMRSGELRDKGEKIRSEYIELVDGDYQRLLAKFYAEMFPQEIEFGMLGKPRMKNNPDVDFSQTARMQLEAIMQPEPQRLNDLAIARANSIAKYLAEQAGVDKNRIYMLATELQTGAADGAVNALLSLNVGH